MRLRRGLVALFLIVALVFTGCFGSFSATNALYGFNKGVTSNGFLQSLLMIVLSPIYGILITGDAFIFNVIEFWTGKRVFADATIERRRDGSVIVQSGEDTFVFTPRDANTLDVTHNGAPLGLATMTADGALVFTDADGTARVLSPEQLEAMRTDSVSGSPVAVY